MAASLLMTPLLLFCSNDEVKPSSADSPRSTLGGGAGPEARSFLPGMGGMGGGAPLKCVGWAVGRGGTSVGAGLCGIDGDGLGGAGRAAFISFPSIG